MAEQKQSLKIIFILNMVIMSIYTCSIRWHVFTSMLRLSCVIAFYFLMLLILPFISYESKSIAHEIVIQYQRFIALLRNTFEDWKKLIFCFLVYTVSLGIDYVCIHIYSMMTGTSINRIIICMVIGLTFLGDTFMLLNKQISKKPEKLFFCCVMIIGTALISASPNMIGINWDDDVHYFRVEALANFADETGYQSDEMLLNHYVDTALYHTGYSEAEQADFNQQLNESFAQRETSIYRSDINVYSICYIPAAVGVVVGRVLHLPFTWILKLAKICNLLFYAILVSAAIKKLNFGKVFTASIALIPTVIYMAGNFSYDPWMIGFMIYGYCCFFSFLQDHDKKMNVKEMVLMLGAFILAIIPKAVYFVIMFPLFLLPKTAFNTKHEHKKYIFWLFISGLFLASTFLLPLMIHGAGQGDLRGENGVNAAEQIVYILENPSTFFAMMIHFLSDYLNIANSGDFTMYFSYLGQGSIAREIPIAIVLATAVLDKNGTKGKTVAMIIVTVSSFFVTVFLVATAMYISFTPVGLNTVLGCQYRYLIPVLFPLFYMICPDCVHVKINQTLFTSISLMGMSVIFLLNTMPMLSLLY